MGERHPRHVRVSPPPPRVRAQPGEPRAPLAPPAPDTVCPRTCGPSRDGEGTRPRAPSGWERKSSVSMVPRGKECPRLSMVGAGGAGPTGGWRTMCIFPSLPHARGGGCRDIGGPALSLAPVLQLPALPGGPGKPGPALVPPPPGPLLRGARPRPMAP